MGFGNWGWSWSLVILIRRGVRVCQWLVHMVWRRQAKEGWWHFFKGMVVFGRSRGL